MGTARASPAPLRALGPPPFPARPCSPRGAGRPAHGQASGVTALLSAARGGACNLPFVDQINHF